MNPCPNCGIVGNNFSCHNHISYLGVNPNLDLVPPPQTSVNWINSNSAQLFAEIGRLNVLLHERDKEIERLKGLMPPYAPGPGFVGQGSWSVYAENVAKDRDALREEVTEKKEEIERLGRENHLLCNLRDNLFEERRELKECLRWYVENDDTNDGGSWQKSNAHWLEGKRRAMRALGMEEE